METNVLMIKNLDIFVCTLNLISYTPKKDYHNLYILYICIEISYSIFRKKLLNTVNKND
jgi:hypothetical protein